MSLVSGWRVALRLAWREAWRAKGRSLLVLVMVTFPVVAVVAADIAQATASVSSVEGLDRRIGASQARLTIIAHADQVFQTPDPDSGGFGVEQRHGGPTTRHSLADVEKALGGTRPALPVLTRVADVTTDIGTLRVSATGVDLGDPLARGLFRVTAGRAPRTTGEVAINAALAGHGFGLGDRMTFADGSSATVVGLAESGESRSAPVLVGVPGLLAAGRAPSLRTWLLGGDPITWAQVRAANALGATVLSRDVIEHPPSTSQLPPQFRAGEGSRSTIYAVLALVAVMALIEVVLLAGPAFAVGARRQSRSLALIAANGGTPVQSRRVILGAAVVIGAFAAVVGVVLGIVTAWALQPLLQGMSATWFGPFQIRWEHVLGIAAFGLVSALLAAVVPAWIASRQDVVAVLAGRRGDRAASRRSPFIGVVLIVAGVLAAVAGARQGSGEMLIAVSALLTVFGMIFLVPVVVLGVARLGRRLPLALRYAVRDAARHRTRTVPAVAAVAATVAGVVALSIGNTSDQAQAKADYAPQLPQGYSSVAMNGGHTDWAQAVATVRRFAPDARIHLVSGVAGSRPLTPHVGRSYELPLGFVSTLPLQALVSDGRSVPALVADALPPQEWRRASAALRHGQVVLFGSHDGVDPHARISVGGHRGPSVQTSATIVGVPTGVPTVPGILSPAVAQALHLRVATRGLVLTGPTLTASESSDLQQALTALDTNAYLYTERGYQVSGSERVVLWILFGLAAVLMLGGTLTATFLALSDARPDLATLSAVGASPRTRRAVAASYAVAVGLVGAVLGAAVGFVPGIAVSYPLTRSFQGEPGPSHYLSIPWVEIVGLVVALPLLTALVVGLLARSRLPLVARLD